MQIKLLRCCQVRKLRQYQVAHLACPRSQQAQYVALWMFNPSSMEAFSSTSHACTNTYKAERLRIPTLTDKTQYLSNYLLIEAATKLVSATSFFKEPIKVISDFLSPLLSPSEYLGLHCNPGVCNTVVPPGVIGQWAVTRSFESSCGTESTESGQTISVEVQSAKGVYAVSTEARGFWSSRTG